MRASWSGCIGSRVRAESPCRRRSSREFATPPLGACPRRSCHPLGRSVLGAFESSHWTSALVWVTWRRRDPVPRHLRQQANGPLLPRRRANIPLRGFRTSAFVPFLRCEAINANTSTLCRVSAARKLEQIQSSPRLPTMQFHLYGSLNCCIFY